MKTTKETKRVELSKNFSYINHGQTTTTIPAGRRFNVNRMGKATITTTHIFDEQGLYLRHWLGYNCGLRIPMEYIKGWS